MISKKNFLLAAILLALSCKKNDSSDNVSPSSPPSTFKTETGKETTSGNTENDCLPKFSEDQLSIEIGTKINDVNIFGITCDQKEFDDKINLQLKCLEGCPVNFLISGVRINWNPDKPILFSAKFEAFSGKKSITKELKIEVYKNIILFDDYDGDGHGNGEGKPFKVTSTKIPSGFSTDDTDCDKLDKNKWKNFKYFYIDKDGDSYTSPTISEPLCAGDAPPDPYKSNSKGNDCNDDDKSKWKNFEYTYLDRDGDGYTRPAPNGLVCSGDTIPIGYTNSLGKGYDFDDSTPLITNKNMTLSLGGSFACAFMRSGTQKCWGRNDYGQLGDGTTNQRLTPFTVSGITNAVSMSAGDYHTCTLLLDKTVKCWGNNSYRQLGDEIPNNRYNPTTVMNLTNVLDITSRTNQNCALLGDGTVSCWGNGNSMPVVVLNLKDALSIRVGYYDFRCAQISDGSIKCWGSNGSGYLGNGTYEDSNTPVQVLGLKDVRSISTGAGHSCAVLSDKTAKCWGSGDSLQLGDGIVRTNSSKGGSNKPVEVSGLRDVMGISAGDTHTCAVMSDNTAKCWGSNTSGQLGDGTNKSSGTPISVLGLTNVLSIHAGIGSTCATLLDGFVKCWGRNDYGQLGDGTTINRTSPVTVLGLSLLD